MYDADLSHDNPSLEEKLRALYGLNRNKALDLSFRPAFLELLEKMGNPHLNLSFFEITTAMAFKIFSETRSGTGRKA